MKLVRFGPKGAEKPGLLDADGNVRDLSGIVPDISGDTLSDASLARLRALSPTSLPLAPKSARLGACVAGVGKFICVGLNFRDHARESNMTLPAEPVLFMKATSAIAGPDDPTPLPRGAAKMDWEVELAVVIGTRAKHVPLERALEHVAGYCVANDLSERAFQLEGTGQWTKGKSCDGFGPIGPWLVTRDEIPNPQNLKMWLEVDGYRHQDGTSSDMVFGVAELVSYISRFMSLLPGDIISTGTPAGVGLGLKPPTFLRAGQHMRVGIQGLGEQNQIVVDEA
jgi:2-keto-4-pentenoate hydratase/2-oxohepta-3-ene-1,7-dioic acid hydratase in catechol pathway